VQVPNYVADVPDGVLTPRSTWADPAAYDQQARILVQKFQDNFKQFEAQVSKEVAASGPQL
jgi:phosphoenolpyruvate carboxykinase (ATP)